MSRLLFFSLAYCLTFTNAFADEQSDRVSRGETKAYLQKNIGPLVKGIKQAKRITLYEGLPHQKTDAFRDELKNKKTIELHEFSFYDEAITPDADDAKELAKLCGNLKTFDRYEGAKFCGGYHPDWCVEFMNGNDIYQVHICFGCHEARLYGPKNEVYSDLDGEAYKRLVAVLTRIIHEVWNKVASGCV